MGLKGFWVDVESLSWVCRALGGCEGPEMGIEGFGRYGGSQMGMEGVRKLFWMA